MLETYLIFTFCATGFLLYLKRQTSFKGFVLFFQFWHILSLCFQMKILLIFCIKLYLYLNYKLSQNIFQPTKIAKNNNKKYTFKLLIN